MARILSIDYGKKRTGIAVTDPLQIIANGLATVSTSELFDYLKNYISQEEVERVIIGKPLQTNGLPSENLQRVEQFVNRWRKAMPAIPIEYVDERLTTVSAQKLLISADVRREKRKTVVDKVAACIILQSYLDRKL